LTCNSQYYVCGSSKVSKGIKDIFGAIIKEARSCTDEEAAAAFEQVTAGRYATDIFE
jgi:cytochrome P450 / NADPH-cytochrome P450 reductase